MTVKYFLLLHQGGGCQDFVSIHQLPYDDVRHGYTKTYFEEESQEEIITSDAFKDIANKEVDHFHVIGGGAYPVELCVYLKSEEKGLEADKATARIIIKGTHSIEEYKKARLLLEDYAAKHEVSEMRWQNGYMFADGVLVQKGEA